MIKQLSTKVVLDTPYIVVHEDDIEYSSGKRGKYYVADRGNAVIIIVVVGGDKLLLQKQYRYPCRQWFWEMPAGKIGQGEDSEPTAIRELQEETNISVSSLKSLGKFYPTTGLSDTTSEVFVAEVDSLDMSTLGTDDLAEEIAEYKLLSFAEFEEWIRTGEMVDAFALAAYMIFRAHFS